jgi:hypothetical protein
MKVTAEFDPKELKALDKDLDDLLVGIAKELSSVPKMKPMVKKVQDGMRENSMGFSNSEIWEKTKHAAKVHGLVDFDSPLATTGQLIQDFKFEKAQVGVKNVTKSDEIIIGGFTWDSKERKRPTYRHILNQLAIKEGGVSIYDDADQYSFLGSDELIKIVMKSPRYPVMDSILNLYKVDIQLHMERLIDEAFSKKR